MFRGDFHIHSNRSNDGFMNPRTIIKSCKKLGMNMIAITDHDTMEGFNIARGPAKELGIELVPGMEITTSSGHLIALNIGEPIGPGSWESVIDSIRSQGALVVMPHPYRSHQNIERMAKECDIIETFNARTPPSQNSSAADLSRTSQ